MKNEIDLRAPEFIAAARLRRCRLYLSILIAITASVALLGCYLLQLGAGAMQQEIARLRAATQALRGGSCGSVNEIAPLNAETPPGRSRKNPLVSYLCQLQRRRRRLRRCCAPGRLGVRVGQLDAAGYRLPPGFKRLRLYQRCHRARDGSGSGPQIPL